MSVDVSFSQDHKIICWAHNCHGEYGKPFLIISDNNSKTPYFKRVSSEFEKKLKEIGLDIPMVEWFPTSRSYRLPENGWWNNKERKWYEKEEWMSILNKIFSEIKEDFNAGKFD